MRQIVVTIKRDTQTLVTWTTTAPAAESNEQNNTKDLCVRDPDRTTFHGK